MVAGVVDIIWVAVVAGEESEDIISAAAAIQDLIIMVVDIEIMVMRGIVPGIYFVVIIVKMAAPI
jgi:hypothetical protein